MLKSRKAAREDRAGKRRSKEAPQQQIQTTMPEIPGKFLAPKDRAGVKLCAHYQSGQCSVDPCDEGAHRCAVVMRSNSGRVCGANSHGAWHCTVGPRHRAVQTAVEHAGRGEGEVEAVGGERRERRKRRERERREARVPAGASLKVVGPVIEIGPEHVRPA